MTPIDGLGARQIEFSSEKGAHRELAGLGRPRSGLQQRREQQFEQRRTGQRVNLGHVLSGIGVRRGPEIDVGGKRRRDGREQQFAG